MLEKKIHVEYVSEEAFETLMRATVIAFMARSPWDVNIEWDRGDVMSWYELRGFWIGSKSLQYWVMQGYAIQELGIAVAKENMFSTQGAKQTASLLT